MWFFLVFFNMSQKRLFSQLQFFQVLFSSFQFFFQFSEMAILVFSPIFLLPTIRLYSHVPMSINPAVLPFSYFHQSGCTSIFLLPLIWLYSNFPTTINLAALPFYYFHQYGYTPIFLLPSIRLYSHFPTSINPAVLKFSYFYQSGSTPIFLLP